MAKIFFQYQIGNREYLYEDEDENTIAFLERLREAIDYFAEDAKLLGKRYGATEHKTATGHRAKPTRPKHPARTRKRIHKAV